jgi:NAD+ diphosphatase
MEMNFCRRCGAEFASAENHVYKCKNGHILFANASPASCAWLVNNKNELLVAVRSQDPGKGLLDAPGGFNDGAETFEDSLARELEEEIGFKPSDYTKPEYLLSSLDKYDYKGERFDIISVVYWARIIGNPTITPQDDIAEAKFMPVQSIDPEKIYFHAVREAFFKLREML